MYKHAGHDGHAGHAGHETLIRREKYIRQDNDQSLNGPLLNGSKYWP